jgi:predicted anti-sigma-YlaC factor YlaD
MSRATAGGMFRNVITFIHLTSYDTVSAPVAFRFDALCIILHRNVMHAKTGRAMVAVEIRR